ncbi:peptide chain release factor N(5)-glutamine methyltransferase [Tessaracoccus sp. OS52]|uniref:peptide chain release factor N(5)-glutamine methyltransferase n=1 Tax=Tessaracoccus sp. OS52 TaxID=2886691 RepID=UPI001D12EFFC|nr:peptide chain release factor N(5)-glutamine methyltransferase [Tessaracoccus sp. OS52]
MTASEPAYDVALAAAAKLAQAGLPSPGADARILLAHVMGLGVSAMLLAPGVSPVQRATLDALLARRIGGEPVQHLTGEAHFRYETLVVGPGVFIPRPETELLVDLALKALSQRRPGCRRVVEFGAGSGAISLSLAKELGGLDLHAVELSDEAWPYLERNLAGVDIELVHGDMGSALAELAGEVDLVISNPPYVPEAHRRMLPADVVGRDPDLALFSGADGLDAIRVVRDRAAELLRPGGWVMVEHDESHADDVIALFRGPEFRDATGHHDLTGRPRHATARRQGPDMAGLDA